MCLVWLGVGVAIGVAACAVTAWMAMREPM
jgi:hypothetical protein